MLCIYVNMYENIIEIVEKRVMFTVRSCSFILIYNKL